jgi:DNA-binding MarR family transcriptional regulator
MPLLGFMLRDALRLLHADFRRRVTERGFRLTPALYRLLFRLQRNPGCRQVELADFLEVTPVTVGRMVDRLEKRRLVRRGRHPEDRRAIRVFLDRRGSELMTQLEEVARLTEERALEGFSARERAALRHALARVHANLSTAP